jgi:hypothetical protein
LQNSNAYAIKIYSYFTKFLKHKGYKNMASVQLQKGSLASSFARAVNALVGTQQLLDDYSSAAAHYDGLIDIIERAGWDLSKLERVKHSLDETAQHLLGELTENLPDMSQAEEQSFLAPFHNAIHQFSHMTVREKQDFRAEYSRFAELHAKSLQEFASADIA